MALWPFRRKSRRKKAARKSAGDETSRGRPVENAPPPRRQTEPVATTAADTSSPSPFALRSSTRKQRPSPNKLQRKNRAYSFSPGRHDSIRVGRRESGRAKKREPVPPHPNAAGAHPAPSFNYPSHRDDDGDKYDSGVDALRDSPFPRAPTLHNKRDGDHLPHKKSSKKRRKNDSQREAEIKAMSNFVPYRPAAEDWTAGRPMKKDSKRVRSSFGFGFKGARHEWDKENRESDVSLPGPESLRSTLSSDSDPITFKVSALEALAPRPTLRYVSNPRLGSTDGAPPARRPTQARKLSAPIPESTLRAHKRIDDLANDLSASDLRELMERDTRRRERRREREREKMERKLARRAEKMKEAEADAQREGRESPPNLERGVFGREAIGLGIDPASAIITSSRRRSFSSSPTHSPTHSDKSLEAGYDDAMDIDSRPHPLDAFHRTTSIQGGTVLSPQAPEEPEPVPEPAPAPSPKSRNLLRKKSRSKSPQSSEARVVVAPSETSRKPSESSSKAISWMSIFKWGGKKKRNSGGPSSFSNTSRDSMQTAQQLPAPTPPVNFASRKLGSNVPKRTMSRFREDLPELPMSPPESRYQSPEAEHIPATVAEGSPNMEGRAEEEMMSTQVTQGPRYDTPTSGHRSIPREASSSLSHREEFTPSPEPHSMSLASIDSEGSWLSGRMGKKRRSSGILEVSARAGYPQRNSGSDKSQSQERENTNEEASVADDEYLSKLAPDNKKASWNRASTGEARPSSDIDEDEGARWGSVRGQLPTVIHEHVVDRMKSHEGLLNSYGEEDEEEEEHEARVVDPVVDAYVKEIDAGAGLQRATSIKLNDGHARKISAGSAKLLSITPRSSLDARRRSRSPKLEEV